MVKNGRFYYLINDTKPHIVALCVAIGQCLFKDNFVANSKRTINCAWILENLALKTNYL